jgi:hypothetical protein
MSDPAAVPADAVPDSPLIRLASTHLLHARSTPTGIEFVVVQCWITTETAALIANDDSIVEKLVKRIPAETPAPESP